MLGHHFGWSRVTSKKNFRPVIAALSDAGEDAVIDQVQLVAPQVFNAWRCRVAAQITGEAAARRGGSGSASWVGKLAHPHVIEHALAQRTDGLGDEVSWLCSY
jgi:hypothetical protein